MAEKSTSLKTVPASKAALSRVELRSAGRALRDKVSRRSHADWPVSSDRQDPIELLIESNKGRIPQLIPIRYGRMKQSPFAFFRGAASIMAADLASTPTSGIYVQACGDCHLLNFGGYATRERRIVFDINDFDETLPSPWEWDIKRLAASVVIAGRQNGFKIAEARKAAVSCVQSYREHMQVYAEKKVLEMWYERIDAEALIASVNSRTWKKSVQGRIAKESARTVLEDEFPKLASVKNGKVSIKDNPPLIFHQSNLGIAEYLQIIRKAFRRYRETLTDDLKALLDHYEIKDVAWKVAGVGSVGTRCGILLMMAGYDDVLFLQTKEARASVLEPYAGKSGYQNCGQRVVAGQRLMQSASDMFLGWTEERGSHFYVRQLRDIKIKPHVEAFDAPVMAVYAGWCGWALARAHAKSGGAAMISGYLGNTSKFDEAIASFAETYADQNERDHQDFLKAIHAGKIEVYEEQ